MTHDLIAYDPDHAVKCPVEHCEAPGFKSRQAVWAHLARGHKLGSTAQELANQAVAAAVAAAPAVVGKPANGGPPPAEMAPEHVATFVSGLLAEYPQLKSRSADLADRNAKLSQALLKIERLIDEVIEDVVSS